MNDIVEISGTGPPQLKPLPMSIVERAVAQGASIEMVEKLWTLQERVDATNARKAFDSAVAAAHAEMGPVARNKTGHNQKRYADFAAIAAVVDPIISKHGLSYRFRTDQTANISVTCVLAHRDGHSEQTTLSAQADSSGNKNTIQALGSTLTYLQRYSLVQMLGIAVSDDDDGAASGSGDTIADDQVADLQAMIESIGGDKAEGLKKGFLKKFKIEGLAQLPVSEWRNAVAALQAKRAA